MGGCGWVWVDVGGRVGGLRVLNIDNTYGDKRYSRRGDKGILIVTISLFRPLHTSTYTTCP